MKAASMARHTFIYQLFEEAKPKAKNAAEHTVILPAISSSYQTEINTSSPYPQNDRQLSKWLISHRNVDGTREGLTPNSIVSSPLYDETGSAYLSYGHKVLFIGDSMMEGVAPRVIKLLKDTYKVESINLSKRSTGLAYPGFFNWPEATAKALAEHKDIGLLAVFLGPNDPWDMPRKKGQPYLRFGSEEWAGEYRHRINQILDCARQYNIPVIWVLPPNMKKQKLNQAMAVLNHLYESEVNSVGGIILNVNDLFGYKEGVYTQFSIINGKKINVRASDGIHYSSVGAQLIANAMMRKINFSSDSNEEIDNE